MCCTVFSLAAKAEGNLTFYGSLDAGTTFSNNQFGKSGWKQSMSSDSYFGVRGSEDIGKGVKAIFTLESAFDVNNGKLKSHPQLFGNQAFVGLSGDQVGTLTFGRQTDSMVDYVAPLTLTGGTFGADMFAHPYDNDNLSNSFRVNNSVKYESPALYGFRLGAMYGFSNSPGHFARNRAYSIGGTYQLGGLSIGAAYLQQNGNTDSSPAALPGNEGAVGSDTPFHAGRRQTWGAGISYTAGPATAGVVVSQTHLSRGMRISDDAAGTPMGNHLVGRSADFKNIEGNFRYALTQSLGVGAAYTYTLADVAGVHQHWQQYSMETDYSLSKRTNLYLQGTYQRVNGTDHAVISGLEASDGKTQLALSVGLKHRF
ncbi:porin [Paraburkholderia caribensis]|uniref:porin n=1 Tax=Paraburkholderia caribensis TaxID=75105 RepID=UPI001CC42596|nr:porin [Paraburkholderia caribensis]